VSVSVPLDGVEAKLSTASKAPAEQRPKAMKARGWKMPDEKAGFFLMMFFLRSAEGPSLFYSKKAVQLDVLVVRHFELAAGPAVDLMCKQPAVSLICPEVDVSVARPR
jgi:hypothetical protein